MWCLTRIIHLTNPNCYCCLLLCAVIVSPPSLSLSLSALYNRLGDRQNQLGKLQHLEVATWSACCIEKEKFTNDVSQNLWAEDFIGFGFRCCMHRSWLIRWDESRSRFPSWSNYRHYVYVVARLLIRRIHSRRCGFMRKIKSRCTFDWWEHRYS